MVRPGGVEPPRLHFVRVAPFQLGYGRKVVWGAGFEPALSGARTRRPSPSIGTPARSRTLNLRICQRSGVGALRYQLRHGRAKKTGTRLSKSSAKRVLARVCSACRHATRSWRRRGELNPEPRLDRPLCCRYTTPPLRVRRREATRVNQGWRSLLGWSLRPQGEARQAARRVDALPQHG